MFIKHTKLGNIPEKGVGNDIKLFSVFEKLWPVGPLETKYFMDMALYNLHSRSGEQATPPLTSISAQFRYVSNATCDPMSPSHSDLKRQHSLQLKQPLHKKQALKTSGTFLQRQILAFSHFYTKNVH